MQGSCSFTNNAKQCIETVRAANRVRKGRTIVRAFGNWHSAQQSMISAELKKIEIYVEDKAVALCTKIFASEFMLD